ncbi:MAG: undecaprenyldiphospho-muramoylpentapeptide beta-N-acetylglucosaminyltransferase [Oscillospiraceae bacterium]|nr:undecaprenyldiphospho-muramoylpentapeptide beta-N-acetylglucosaminyltransferase [Oscillospiraceae bacterium]
MKVIIAAGGTAGHINPGLAIAQHIKTKHPDAEIMFVGRKSGMEYGLVTKAGYSFAHMEVTGFQRRLNLNNIKRNLITVKNLMTASAKAKKIIKDFGPDLVIGTGGYVCGPIVLQAAKMGIKTAIHEQNAFPGVTNKLLSKSVDYVFIATEKAAKYMAHPEKCILCGNPVREEVQAVDVAESRRRLGVEGKTVLLSFGGSLGAMAVNNAMKNLVVHNRDRKDVVHYHVVGRYDEGEFEAFLKENNIEQSENLQVFEYLYDIPKYMAAADIIISRCGALTIAEIACIGKASILIPSPNVAENHQFHNGKVLSDIGAAILIEEKDLNKESITEAFDALYSDKTRTEQMGQTAKTVWRADCLDIIYSNLFSE